MKTKKNRKKEMVFLTNFQQDLKSDLQKLDTLKATFETAAQSKKLFESVFDGHKDSDTGLAIHFKNQYSQSKDFTPNTITISELKNSAGISVISNPKLRRQLVSLYNTYDNLATKLTLGTEKIVHMTNYASSHFNDVLNPADEEVKSMLKDSYFKNQIRANYVLTQLEAVKKAHDNCKLTLTLIEGELDD
jgi:hypothetical protein